MQKRTHLEIAEFRSTHFVDTQILKESASKKKPLARTEGSRIGEETHKHQTERDHLRRKPELKSQLLVLSK